jgi:hypothetical protein
LIGSYSPFSSLWFNVASLSDFMYAERICLSCGLNWVFIYLTGTVAVVIAPIVPEEARESPHCELFIFREYI